MSDKTYTQEEAEQIYRAGFRAGVRATIQRSQTAIHDLGQAEWASARYAPLPDALRPNKTPVAPSPILAPEVVRQAQILKARNDALAQAYGAENVSLAPTEIAPTGRWRGRTRRTVAPTESGE